MSRTHSTPAKPPRKPAKPATSFIDSAAEYPLTVNPCGYFSKKIRGKVYYFGRWDQGAEAAEAEYLRQKDDLHAGRLPGVEAGGATVKALCNAFWNTKNLMVQSGELSPRTFADYERTTDLLGSHFDKGRLVADIRPEEFTELRAKMAKKWGPHMLGKMIQCIRCTFKFGFDSGMLATPIRFGPGFKRPSKKTLRLERRKAGPKVFWRDEIHALLKKANPPMKAMILLGINAGLGNADCARLTTAAIDLAGGWLRYPREKTGVDRTCPLWPETVTVIGAALMKRPKPKEAGLEDRVFITKQRGSWHKDTSDNPVSKEFRKLLDEVGINGHRNFYTLRHTFRTIADAAKDQPAIDHIMGHESTHMSTAYREWIDEGRLKAVAEHVRTWLFGAAAKQ